MVGQISGMGEGGGGGGRWGEGDSRRLKERSGLSAVQILRPVVKLYEFTCKSVIKVICRFISLLSPASPFPVILPHS